MKINDSSPLFPSVVSGPAPSTTRALEALQGLEESDLEKLSPQQLSELREYMTEGHDDVKSLRGSFLGLPMVDLTDSLRMEKAFRTLDASGRSLRALLQQNPAVKHEVEEFLQSKRSQRTRSEASADQDPNGRARDLVAKNFDRWDANHDGQLSQDELRAAIADPSVQGDDALALAALCDALFLVPDGSPGLADGSVSKGDLKGLHIGGQYVTAQRRAKENKGTEVFNGPIDPGSVSQGRHGSCNFLAALISLATDNPQAIHQMIKDNKDGSYTVTFPNQEPVTVTLSDTERCLGAKGNGLWVAILEKAYAVVEAKQGGVKNPYQIYEGGHGTQDANAALTGDNSVRQYMLQPSENGKYAAFEPSETGEKKGGKYIDKPDFRSLISEALKNGRPVQAAIFEEKNPWGIKSGHAYAIVGMNGDNVTLRNPWGAVNSSHSEPSDRHGALDGKRDGMFTISLGDLLAHFRDITC